MLPLGLVVLLAWILLLLRFPRIMIPASLGVLAVALLLAVSVGVKQWLDSRQLARIDIRIEYAPQQCEFGKPLLVRIDNRSERTAQRISWQLLARQPGYSSNLIDTGSTDAGWETDRALAPGEQWQHCLRLPRLRSGYQPAELEYQAQRVRAVLVR
ncbi:MAG: multidrug transporter [Halopseudomonas yangmingensis]|uniref:Multidrug transporter n=1 Tax=Halopseudomonas yangmingensis TaxID=1720063 RepID=A0A1I4P4U1_9GAMM|nr:hypothetical protein [Halopseudomonas yangmingensis]SFM22557.1 hypothetical protein SAMN05216217_102109 [Halopseudomonas yangmingensis]